ncbi:MAG: protein translocase SEC61 complex subunit gamma [Candidatus Micrarchaeota archaeon]
MEIGEIIKRCLRVFYISKKPTDEDFRKVAKVTAVGIIVIGVIGLLISLITALF